MTYFKDIYTAGRLSRKHKVPKKLWWNWQKSHFAVGWRITYKALFVVPIMLFILPFAIVAQAINSIINWLTNFDCMYIYNEKTHLIELKREKAKNKLWEHIPQLERKNYDNSRRNS